jgi:hypothetical protein
MNPRKLDNRGKMWQWMNVKESNNLEQMGNRTCLGLNLDNLSLNFCWIKLGFIINHKYWKTRDARDDGLCFLNMFQIHNLKKGTLILKITILENIPWTLLNLFSRILMVKFHYQIPKRKDTKYVEPTSRVQFFGTLKKKSTKFNIFCTQGMWYIVYFFE